MADKQNKLAENAGWDRELLALEHRTRGDAPDGLQRLEAGAGEDQRVSVAMPRDDIAVRRENHRRAGMS